MNSESGRRSFVQTIRGRVLLQFGVTLVVLFVVTAVAVLTMRQVQSVVSDFLEEELPRAEQVRLLNRLVEGVALGAERLPEALSKTDLEEIYEGIDESLMRLEVAADALSRRGVDSETLEIRRRLQLVRAEAQLGFQLQGAAFDLAAGTGSEGAESEGAERRRAARAAELQRTADAVLSGLQRSVEEVVDLSDRYTREMLAGFEQRKARVLSFGRWAMILVAGFSLLAAGAVSVVLRQLVLHGFSRRLEVVRQALARLPETEEETRVSVAGHDEIAEMARRVEVLLGKALRIQQLTKTDDLTGLDNRRSFFEQTSVQRKQAYRSRRTDSLLMADVDHFKSINDTKGHDVGDQVLRAVGNTIRSCLRETDVLARVGGEEFAVYCPDTAGEAARSLAERIGSAVRGLDLETMDRPVTLSVGVAEIPPDATSLTRWLKKADRALYAAKDSGRDRVVLAGRE